MRVSIGDVTLFVEIFGEPEHGATVIGLHGGPGLDGSKLRYQLEPLADVAHIVVPDQRGHSYRIVREFLCEPGTVRA